MEVVVALVILPSGQPAPFKHVPGWGARWPGTPLVHMEHQRRQDGSATRRLRTLSNPMSPLRVVVTGRHGQLPGPFSKWAQRAASMWSPSDGRSSTADPATIEPPSRRPTRRLVNRGIPDTEQAEVGRARPCHQCGWCGRGRCAARSLGVPRTIFPACMSATGQARPRIERTVHCIRSVPRGARKRSAKPLSPRRIRTTSSCALRWCSARSAATR